MATTPHQWWQYVQGLCLRAGLTEDDANDCVWAVLARYQQRRGSYPWEEPSPDLRLLGQLTRNIVAESCRANQRRHQNEQSYYAFVAAIHAATPSPYEHASAQVDYERFLEFLPSYLQRTLLLLMDGYTPDEIAQRLQVVVGTVYAYRQQLREKFVEFYGYDPRISGSCVVNYSGNAEGCSQSDTQEVTDDATSQSGNR